MNYYSFYTGKEFEAYCYLGVHHIDEGWVFRTFAPQARRVNLVLENEIIQMLPVYDGNFYEVVVKDVKEGDLYEFQIYDEKQGWKNHIDPFGFEMELRPKHKSVVMEVSEYEFQDAYWMGKRNNMVDKPLNIYEIHAGSWKKPCGGSKEYYSYDELAAQLIPYLKEMHYNYVEFMPICEYPADESWGYQITGFFSPTARYGNAKNLMKAIDLFHENSIGVLLDFVPAHFAIDDYGLRKYDGTSLYEYPYDDIAISEWGSCNFMHSRGEVQSFLQSSANYWLSRFHFDGLRIDAVSRLLYWQGDEKRGENNASIDFIKTMNAGLKQRNSGIMLIAEDSSNFPGVTKPLSEGGLGFDYKWNLGWMHDVLEYFQSLPCERGEKYHKLTFSMLYFYNERYLLPFSHDEVVHGKATILQKMSGDYEDKFPQARALYMFMMLHPGKKLNFMGNEIGQLREWDEKREQDWLLLKYPIHDAFMSYIACLNRIYTKYDALWSFDYEFEGFEWLDCHNDGKCIYCIMRRGKNSNIVGIVNLGDSFQRDYRVTISNVEKYEVLLYTDWDIFGGHTNRDKEKLSYVSNQMTVDMAPFSGMLIKIK